MPNHHHPYCERNTQIREQFRRQRETGQRSREVIERLAEEVHRSVKCIEKVVYREANASPFDEEDEGEH